MLGLEPIRLVQVVPIPLFALAVDADLRRARAPASLAGLGDVRNCIFNTSGPLIIGENQARPGPGFGIVADGLPQIR